MTYFKNYTKRFFFLYGQTKDEFYTSDLKVANLEEVLHKHLQNNGYERIVFYQGQAKGVCCFDQQSYDLSFNQQKIKEKNDKSKTIQHQNNKILSGVLGKRIAKKTDHREMKFDSSKTLSKKMGDVDIVNHFDHLLSDDNIQTAIVFSDFNDFILHTEHEVVRNFNSKIGDWDGLSSQNKNIIIFVVPSGISLHTIKRNTENYDQWQTLTSKMFVSNDAENFTTTEQLIMIGQPYKDEIKNLINYHRIKNDLAIDWLEFDENIDLLVKISKEHHLSLKELSMNMYNLKSFSKEQLQKLFNIHQEKSGFDKLKEMKGLEYLVSEIEKVVKYANSKKTRSEEVVFKEVRRILPEVKKQKNDYNLHLVLTGNPGTGKTTVAKIISEVFKDEDILDIGHIVKVTRDDLVSQYIGETAIKTKEKIDEAMGGVLFIDEAYTLSKSQVEYNNNHDHGQEAIDTILEAMTDRMGEFSVVVAGYPKEMDQFINSNPGLQRRFANKIHIEDYKPDVLVDIFITKMDNSGYSMDNEFGNIFLSFIENWFDARDEKTFGNAGDILNLFDEMAKNANVEHRKVLTKQDIPEKFQYFLKTNKDNLLDDVLKKLDNIIGLESVKENVKSIIASIKMAHLRDPDSKVIAGHYVFKGNPGTGKTTVARIMGEVFKELKILKKGHFVEATREQLVQGYVGQTATKTKEVLESALGGVLFIDEAYSLAQGGENDFGKEAIDTIVPFMENHRDDFILIVAGYDEDMDKFFDANTGLKSRFTSVIYFEDYTEDELVEIFKIFAKEKNYVLSTGVEERLKSLFTRMKSNSKYFGNGRDVRKLFDLCRTDLDKRLLNFNDLQPHDRRLYEITLEDLPN